MRSTLLRLVAAVALLPVVAVPAAASPAVPKIDWKACGSEYPGLDCATVPVPLDYDNPRGATTKVALARKPASDKANRIGTLFINPGGPGGSGVEFALGAGNELDKQLKGRFDIVGFDPRGIGQSDPIHCFASEEELNKFFEGIPAFPYQADQERPYFDRLRSLAPKCLAADRTIARHMSTADVARDMDLLRQAVGDKKISYLGFSYGTFLGATYANLFPNNIRALAIDGVLNPELWSSGRQIQSDRIATAEEFGEFLKLCDAAGSACAFHTPGGAVKRWERTADSIRKKPIKLGDELVTYDVLINFVVGAMYGPEGWGGPQGAGAVLDQIADVVEGSVSAASAPFTREADYANGFDAYNGNVCADIQMPSRFGEYQAIGRYAEAGSRFGPLWWWGNAACADWPVNDDRYTGPWNHRTSAPVLVVGNHFDGITDFRGAQAVARQLPNSRLLAYAGWGHTAYGRSGCTTEYMNNYLLTGALPPVGTVCAANPNPFLPSVASVSAGLPVAPRR
ncbi:hydrolase [Lentzea sp. NBRC 105346]|uniref:alpha/beta hydrolase n=1 Tax=Lentzea sp. NBRC 105346 TaxID=3032205 RepID=UPI0024A43B10|nr:alpha/beta hydrolase [Lentzea sp. NBRC 105346]GLZ33321.1 hydrolase [Lentzea sp. NBRC 105346]